LSPGDSAKGRRIHQHLPDLLCLVGKKGIQQTNGRNSLLKAEDQAKLNEEETYKGIQEMLYIKIDEISEKHSNHL